MKNIIIFLERFICQLFCILFIQFPKRYWKKYREISSKYQNEQNYFYSTMLALCVLPFLFAFFILAYAFLIPLFILFELPLGLFYILLLLIVSPTAFIIFPYQKPSYSFTYSNNHLSTKLINFPKHCILIIHMFFTGNLLYLNELKNYVQIEHEQTQQKYANFNISNHSFNTSVPFKNSYIVKISIVALIYSFIPIACIVLALQGVLLVAWFICCVLSVPVFFIEIIVSIVRDIIVKK